MQRDASGPAKNVNSAGSTAQLVVGAFAAWMLLRHRPATVRVHAPGKEPPPRTEHDTAGRHAWSPIEIPPRGWWAVLLRVWDQLGKDNMSIVAAGCAFYAMLALFPAITALVSIYGLIADPAEIERQVEQMRGVLPQEAVELIVTQARQVASGATSVLGWSAALALVLALYSASSGVKALFTALDIAYEERESRSLIRVNATAIAFTLAAILGAIVGLVVILGVPAVLSLLPLGTLAEWGVRIASWLVLLALVMGGLAAIYRFGPDRAAARWRWITPGSVLATVLWLAASAGFSWYAANFASYNQTYGALGGVIILLFWLYLTAYVILLGAELNAELEMQTEQDTTTGPVLPMGRRRAYAADHTAGSRSR